MAFSKKAIDAPKEMASPSRYGGGPIVTSKVIDGGKELALWGFFIGLASKHLIHHFWLTAMAFILLLLWIISYIKITDY